MKLFEALGFQWDRSASPSSIPRYSIERVCFRFYKMLPEFIWDAAVLESNPYTFSEIKTLLDGITVGGRRIADQRQILNLIETAKLLLKTVRSGRFRLDKSTFVQLHGLVARDEAAECGPFTAIKGGANLDEAFSRGVAALDEDVPDAFEKGAAFFLFGALQQFFFDGNKRTSRFMMNGVLMSHGIDAISIPAAKAQVFNEKMIRFYQNRDATEMLRFLVECHPEAK